MSLQNIKLFFTPQYLFNPYPSYDMKYLNYLLGFFILLLILAIIAYIFSKKNRKKPAAKIWERVYDCFLWTGVIGLVLLGSRYEGIAYLSMRFILLAWMVFFIGWFVSILIYWRRGYRKILKEHKEKLEKEKYFKKK